MDIHEYMENHRYGYDLVKGETVKYEYYDFEREFINNIVNYKFSITKKARQMHVTNLLSHYVTWFLIFNEDMNNNQIGYISTKMDLSRNFISLVHKNLRHFFAYPIEFERNNKDCIEMVNGNRIKAIDTSKCAMKGWTFDRVIMDEIAFVKDFGELFPMYVSSLATDGYMTLASTPNGIETFFNIWDASASGRNGFKRLSLDWTKNPRRNKEWYDEMCKIYDEKGIKQELHAEFVPYQPKSLKLGFIEPKFSPDAYVIPRKPYIPLEYLPSKIKKVIDKTFKGMIKRIFYSLFSFLKYE